MSYEYKFPQSIRADAVAAKIKEQNREPTLEEHFREALNRGSDQAEALIRWHEAALNGETRDCGYTKRATGYLLDGDICFLSLKKTDDRKELDALLVKNHLFVTGEPTDHSGVFIGFDPANTYYEAQRQKALTLVFKWVCYQVQLHLAFRQESKFSGHLGMPLLNDRTYINQMIKLWTEPKDQDENPNGMIETFVTLMAKHDFEVHRIALYKKDRAFDSDQGHHYMIIELGSRAHGLQAPTSRAEFSSDIQLAEWKS